MVCNHESQALEPSKVAKQVGYSQRGRSDNAKAAGFTGENERNFADMDYLGPLVLPNDEIDFDPKYPPQDFGEWRDLVDSNACPPERTKVYFAAPPGHTRDGHIPLHPKSAIFPPPHPSLVMEYLAVFYYGLEVIELPEDTLKFDKWTEGPKGKSNKVFAALKTPKESIRLKKRLRESHVQLNLSDLLDAAIAVLPEDALALILLINHDMYEDEEDDFTCGRAYGGSHVCVVSTYQYNPMNDDQRDIDREHLWPASHCDKFVRKYEDLFIEMPKRKRKRSPARVPPRNPSMPLGKAIAAHKLLDWKEHESGPSHYLSRVCRTASHELGHCLGIDHCMYYACMMQGTASIAEDLRQPPYLCPVDEAKVSCIIAERGDPAKGSTVGREKALLNFTKKHSKGGGFAAFQAWLEERLAHDECKLLQ